MSQAFAVVKFLSDENRDDDECYSEVPKKWLCENNTRCWWPNTKNLSSLMASGATPGPNWSTYPVQVITFCDTLIAARKRASNVEYTSTEEIEVGRGKRRKIKTCKVPDTLSSSDESDEPDNVTPPPILKHMKQVAKQDISVKSSVLVPVSPAPIITIIETDKNVDLGEVTVQRQVEEFENGEVDVSSANILTTAPGSLSSCTTVTLSENDKLSSTESSTSFEDLRQTCRTILQYVKSINSKLKSTPRPHADYEILDNYLPLKTLDDLISFDGAIEDKSQNIKDIYKQFLASLGGRNSRDNINRILKRVFTNTLATSCSWLGLRGNVKICGRPSINVIKEIIMGAHQDVKEIDFNHAVSEWFRLSSLRIKREKKIDTQ